MQLIPVLDLRDGIVVRARGGRRSEYRPLASVLCDSSAPSDVAQAIRRRFGLSRIYVADLDAIEGRSSNGAQLRRLIDDGFELLVDAGIRTIDGVRPLLDAGVSTVVVGTESLSGPHSLTQLAAATPSERWMLSVDLYEGSLIDKSRVWSMEPIELTELAMNAGCRHVLYLDLLCVGADRGLGTTALAERTLKRFPGASVYLGGGFRIDHFAMLKQIGIAGVLAASVLHDGSLEVGFDRGQTL